MNYETIRDNLVAQVANNWPHPSVKVFYDNAEEVDEGQAADYYVFLSILFDRAEQINIDPNPQHRTYGTVVGRVYCKETLGSRQALAYLTEIANLLKFKNLGGVHTQEPIPGGERAKEGWYSVAVRVPFFADSYT